MAKRKIKDYPNASAAPVDPLEVKISIPTREIEALCVAVLGGNKTAAVDVVNRIREIAEPQNPEIFMK